MKRYKSKKEEYQTALDMLAIGLEGKSDLPQPSKPLEGGQFYLTTSVRQYFSKEDS